MLSVPGGVEEGFNAVSDATHDRKSQGTHNCRILEQECFSPSLFQGNGLCEKSLPPSSLAPKPFEGHESSEGPYQKASRSTNSINMLST